VVQEKRGMMVALCQLVGNVSVMVMIEKLIIVVSGNIMIGVSIVGNVCYLIWEQNFWRN